MLLEDGYGCHCVQDELWEWLVQELRQLGRWGVLTDEVNQ